MGQNKVRIWVKSQNNGFFVKDNEGIYYLSSATVEITCHCTDVAVCQI